MDNVQVQDRILKHQMRLESAARAVVENARGVTLVLRDSGRVESAKALEAVLFQYDAEK